MSGIWIQLYFYSQFVIKFVFQLLIDFLIDYHKPPTLLKEKLKEFSNSLSNRSIFCVLTYFLVLCYIAVTLVETIRRASFLCWCKRKERFFLVTVVESKSTKCVSLKCVFFCMIVCHYYTLSIFFIFQISLVSVVVVVDI